MIGLLLNGLGVVKRSQDGEVNDHPRRQVWMPTENEFNDRLIMTIRGTMCNFSQLWQTRGPLGIRIVTLDECITWKLICSIQKLR